MQSVLHRLLFSPRTIAWVASAALLVAATAAYLLDPSVQRFENTPPLLHLRELLQPFAFLAPPVGVRHWLADLAWAALAALFMAEVLGGSVPRAQRLVLVLLAATSWETLQALDLVRGVFDPRDLAVSALAGAVTWTVHEVFIVRGNTA